VEPAGFEGIAMVVAATFIGLAILTPVLALCARFALKPVMETWMKLKQSQTSDQEKIMQDRRIALLEAELQSLQQMVQQRLDVHEFNRAIGSGEKDRP
jgi:uncharacterized membrane protein YhiD involved in acid resistance